MLVTITSPNALRFTTTTDSCLGTSPEDCTWIFTRPVERIFYRKYFLVDNRKLFFQVPTCCSCHIMGYSYVYPPLKTSSYADSRIDEFEPLPTTPPAFNQPRPEVPPPSSSQSTSGFPSINPQAEFQNFLTNLGSKFASLSRDRVRDQAPLPSQLVPRPSKDQPRPPQRRIRPQTQPDNVKPQQRQKLPGAQTRRFPVKARRRLQPNVPRRKMDEGPVRQKSFLEK